MTLLHRLLPVVLVLAAGPDALVAGGPGTTPFRRGDVNADGALDLSDPISLLGNLFLGSPSVLACKDAADANGDAAIDLPDAISILSFLFQSGTPPPAPGPDACGTAPAPSLGCDSYPPCAPLGPVITAGPTAEPAVIEPGETTGLAVTATGVGGETLAYSWPQVTPADPTGAFMDAGAASTGWTSPVVAAQTEFVLRVTVSAPSGSAQKEVTVTVRAPDRPPVIDAGPSVRPETALPGEPVSLGLGVGDIDNDPLTFTWTQIDPASPQGEFVQPDPGQPDATWTAPEVAAETTFTLQVTVSDGRGQEASATAPVKVTVPSFSSDIQPIFTSNCAVPFCHSGQFPTASQNLEAGNAFTSLVNTSAVAGCLGQKRVLPGDPDHSVLVERISGTACGIRMPKDNPTFFDSNPGLITRIRSWI